MMEVTAHYQGRSRFEVFARDHRLISDQPLDNNGAESGVGVLEVRVAAEKALNPACLGSFRIDITEPRLDERHRAGVLRAARSCLIHNTLSIPPAIDIRVNDIRDSAQAPGGADGHATLETKAISSFGPAA